LLSLCVLPCVLRALHRLAAPFPPQGPFVPPLHRYYEAVGHPNIVAQPSGIPFGCGHRSHGGAVRLSPSGPPLALETWTLITRLSAPGPPERNVGTSRVPAEPIARVP